ncbi:MAG: hypothetical protein M0Z53_15505 [Thermaerobacter sp.]|nr:hypothetical protein [Thermaerobacter sp.]
MDRVHQERDPIDLNLAFSGLFLIFWGLRVWPAVMLSSVFSVISLVLIGFGLGCVGLGLVGKTLKHYRVPVVVLFNLGFMVWAVIHIMAAAGYGTDEIAFDQWAAQLLIRGVNPYTANLTPALSHLGVPHIYFTYTLTGQLVHQLSYPAMAIYPYLPLLWGGVARGSALFTDTVFWMISIALFYALLPKKYQWLALLCGSLSIYNTYLLGGVTDVLFFPFLLVAAYRWDRFNQLPGYWRWGPPVAFGLAAAVKQTVWFVAPFLFLALILEQNDNKKGLMTAWRYALIALLTFAVINAPFIIVNFGAWLHGILLPLTEPTLPAGQGFIDLALFTRIGGGALSLFNDLGILFLVAGLLFLYTDYSLLKPLIFFMPSLILFWSSRSFGSYLIDLVPFAILSGLTITPAPGFSRNVARWRKPGAVSLGTVFLGLVAAIVLSPAPLTISVAKLQAVGQSGRVARITLSVTNHTRRVLRPHFALTTTGQPTGFWAAPDTSLKPYATATIALQAPYPSAMPALRSNFIVDAFTANPDTLSTSGICHAWTIPRS